MIWSIQHTGLADVSGAQVIHLRSDDDLKMIMKRSILDTKKKGATNHLPSISPFHPLCITLQGLWQRQSSIPGGERSSVFFGGSPLASCHD